MNCFETFPNAYFVDQVFPVVVKMFYTTTESTNSYFLSRTLPYFIASKLSITRGEGDEDEKFFVTFHAEPSIKGGYHSDILYESPIKTVWGIVDDTELSTSTVVVTMEDGKEFCVKTSKIVCESETVDIEMDINFSNKCQKFFYFNDLTNDVINTHREIVDCMRGSIKDKAGVEVPNFSEVSGSYYNFTCM